MPVYNVENYIEKCIESLLPEITSETELLIIDDCSPDNSIDLIRKKIDGYDNIHTIKRITNGGLSAARNTGIDNSKGKYCWFIDSDDYILPGAINKILEILKSTIVDLIMFDHIRIDEDNKIIYKSKLLNSCVYISSTEDKLNIIINYLRNDYGFEVWRKIYSLAIIKEKNIRFEPNKEIFAEDICFFIYYINHCKKIITKNYVLYCYLIRNSSIMGKKIEPKINEIVNLCYKVWTYDAAKDLKQYQNLIMSSLLQIELTCDSEKNYIKYIIKIEKKSFLLEMCSKKYLNFLIRYNGYGKKSTFIQICEAAIFEHLIKGNKKRANIYQKILNIINRC